MTTLVPLTRMVRKSELKAFLNPTESLLERYYVERYEGLEDRIEVEARLYLSSGLAESSCFCAWLLSRGVGKLRPEGSR